MERQARKSPPDRKPQRGKWITTPRDLALLQDLLTLRYLTIPQAQRLHFPSRQIALRRTLALAQAGLLDRFRVPGCADPVLRLSARGAGLITDAGGEQVFAQWTRRARPESDFFLRHFIQLTDFRLDLQEACRRSQEITLREFLPEFLAERSASGGVKKRLQAQLDARDGAPLSHTPDGAFCLERTGRTALFFVEMDRGTESVSDPRHGIAKHLRFYLELFACGAYQSYREAFGVGDEFKGFRALFVTTSAERVENIRAAGTLLDAPAAGKRFLWLTTRDQVSGDRLLGPIWRSVDATDPTMYAIGG